MASNYDPMRYSMARAQVAGGMAQGIASSLTDVAMRIPEIAKVRRINEKIAGAYSQIQGDFLSEIKRVNPDFDETRASIQLRKFLNPSVILSKDIPAETRLSLLLKSAEPLQKYIDGLESQSSAKSFMQKARSPITETKTVQAEGPPIQGERAEGPPIQTGERAGEVPMQAGPRTGEVPMEQRTTSRPMFSQEYQQGLYDLSPQAQKMIPEQLGKDVQQTEAIFQNPMKTYEAERDKRLKERKDNISTMTSTDKGAGIKTAIIESNSEVMNLKSKQKQLSDLIKLVNKSENMTSKEMDLGKQMDAQVEIESIAGQLGVPEQLSKDKDFLGRMDDQINRLIDKEQNQQKEWDNMYNELRKREAEEAMRKRTPRPSAPPTKHPIDARAKYQEKLKDMQKQMFPPDHKIMTGEYGIDVMKKGSAIIQAVNSMLIDPDNRAAFAYAFPEETGEIARLVGVQKPSDEKIEEVRSRVKELQSEFYGLADGGQVQSTARGAGF